jgi:hypothetical protein
MYKRAYHRAPLALLGLSLLLAGCSSSGGGGVKYPETGATLEGTVSYGTEKLEVALVIVENESGSATGFVDESGRYKIENVPLGEVNIGVSSEAGKGQAMGRIMAAGRGQGKAAPKIVDVPKQYENPKSSGIKTSIQKGPNTFDVVVPR